MLSTKGSIYENASKMIVFEGPECVGKSTQVQLLAEEFSCAVSKRVRTVGKFPRLSAVVNDIEAQANRTRLVGSEAVTLFDRWQLVSDMVYEKYCYGKTSIFEPLLPVLGNACKNSNIIIVYLDIDQEEMVRRFQIRGDKLRTLDEAIKVHKAYREFFENCPLPYVRIDVTGKSIQKIFSEIVKVTEIKECMQQNSEARIAYDDEY